MEIIEGNLIKLFDQNHFDIIAHGCNCFKKMGSGIAKQIREKFPDAYDADIYYHTDNPLDRLGNYTWCYAYPKINQYKIYNLYTQFNYGKDGKIYLNYDALSLCLYKLNKIESGKRVGLPYLIGCGLGGGDPLIVEGMIERQLKDCDVTLVKFI